MIAANSHLLSYAWALAGLMLIAIDFKLAQTIVLFLMGLAALTVGMALSYAPHLAMSEQIKIFMFASLLWTLVLWRPLQRFKYSNSEVFNNLKGRKVVLVDPILKPGAKGKGKWSGTLVEVQLAEDVKIEAKHGDVLLIESVDGTLFTVRPQQQQSSDNAPSDSSSGGQ